MPKFPDQTSQVAFLFRTAVALKAQVWGLLLRIEQTMEHSIEGLDDLADQYLSGTDGNLACSDDEIESAIEKLLE